MNERNVGLVSITLSENKTKEIKKRNMIEENIISFPL